MALYQNKNKSKGILLYEQIWGLEQLFQIIPRFGAQVDRPPLLTHQTERIESH